MELELLWLEEILQSFIEMKIESHDKYLATCPSEYNTN